jgi:hypothetical protein
VRYDDVVSLAASPDGHDYRGDFGEYAWRGRDVLMLDDRLDLGAGVRLDYRRS